MRWAKPGADEAVAKQDMVGCRASARRQVAHEYRPYTGPLTDQRFWLAWRAPDDSDRFLYEDNLARACMRTKGYAWSTVPQSA